MTRIEVTDALITAAQGGDSDAMWQILSAYEGVMKSAIRTEASKADQDQAEDLLQDARAILIQHVRDFDASSSAAKLSTYAHKAIRHGVALAWTSMSSAVTVEPYTVLAVKRALWRTKGDVEAAWAMVGEGEDERRRMSRETFVSVLEALKEAMSIDMPKKSNAKNTNVCDQAPLSETIPDPDSDFTDPVARRDLARFLLREIPPRQSFTLRAFHGIGMTRMDDTEAALDLAVRLPALRKLRSRGIDSCRSVAAAHGIAA
ncbi:helix-turn-helix domain-containing protein [Streptomyces bikiniensis]|uniref:Helix-turn-helix domain-containing protein n=1 Tax=Streptomyces bikiniensis TaxID=1896 RepID=A0ABW8D5L2_STRBI